MKLLTKIIASALTVLIPAGILASSFGSPPEAQDGDDSVKLKSSGQISYSDGEAPDFSEYNELYADITEMTVNPREVGSFVYYERCYDSRYEAYIDIPIDETMQRFIYDVCLEYDINYTLFMALLGRETLWNCENVTEYGGIKYYGAGNVCACYLDFFADNYIDITTPGGGIEGAVYLLDCALRDCGGQLSLALVAYNYSFNIYVAAESEHCGNYVNDIADIYSGLKKWFDVKGLEGNKIEITLRDIMQAYPNGSYFTANGKSCYHGTLRTTCSNCRLSNIMAAIGKEYDHDIYWNGWTCFTIASYFFGTAFGQMCFDAPVVAQSGTLKKDYDGDGVNTFYYYFSRAQLGDFIELEENGKIWHYAIFISCDEEGLTMLNCNVWGYTGVNVVETRYYTYEELRHGEYYHYDGVRILHSDNYDTALETIIRYDTNVEENPSLYETEK